MFSSFQSFLDGPVDFEYMQHGGPANQTLPFSAHSAFRDTTTEEAN